MQKSKEILQENCAFMWRWMCLLCLAAPAWAETWYVRVDGGSASECTGKADAAYPGEGLAQPCAVNHPFWLLADANTWRIQGGDEVIIGNGSYRMGWGAPGTGAGGVFGSQYAANSRPVGLPPVPSGPTPDQPTRIAGAEAATGCAVRPELWGSGGTYQVINLGFGGPLWTDTPGSSNVTLECLEITDHAQCIYGGFATDPNYCPNQYAPMYNGPWGAFALKGNFVSNLTLRDIYIHGMASGGAWVGPVDGLTVERTVIMGNPTAGWDFDPGLTGRDTHNRGTILFNEFEVSWSGCVESYPVSTDITTYCQEIAPVSADGIGAGTTGGTWIFRNGTVAFNVNDGIDILYSAADGPPEITVEGMLLHSSRGNQLKMSGVARAVNNVMVGDCRYLMSLPYYKGEQTCRAGGHTLAMVLVGDARSLIANNTITDTNHPTAPMLIACRTDTFPYGTNCNDNTALTVENNVFYGFSAANAIYSLTGNANLYFRDWSHNLYFNLRLPCPYNRGETGAVCGADPQLMAPYLDPSFDAHIPCASPATGAGMVVYNLLWDRDGVDRTGAATMDIGAYQCRADLLAPLAGLIWSPPLPPPSPRLAGLQVERQPALSSPDAP